MPPSDDDRDAARPGTRGANLLRDSFSGINERFHLAGIYTLVDLLGVITASALGEDPEWGGLLMLTFVASLGIVFAIYGVVYHAAAGRKEKPAYVHYGTFLFVPLLWLHLKLVGLVYAPLFLGLWTYYALSSIDANMQEWFTTAGFWVHPITTLAVLVLSLYSIPLTIDDRMRSQRGKPIREGLRLLRDSRAEGRGLLVLVLVIFALATLSHFLHGPGSTDLVPSIPEALILLAADYLALVVIFGATRVVLARRPQQQPKGAVSGGPPLAGPEGP